MGIQNHLTLEKSVNKFTYVNILSKEKKHIMSLNNNKIDAKKSIIHLGETLIEGNLLDFIKGILKKKKVQQTYIVVKF